MEILPQLIQALNDYGKELFFLTLSLIDLIFNSISNSRKESIIESKSKTKFAIGNIIRYEKSKHLKKIDSI